MDQMSEVPVLYRRLLRVLIAENLLPPDAVAVAAEKIKDAGPIRLYRGRLWENSGPYDTDILQNEGPCRADVFEASKDAFRFWLVRHKDMNYEELGTDLVTVASAINSADDHEAEVKASFVRDMISSVDRNYYIRVEVIDFTDDGEVDEPTLKELAQRANEDLAEIAGLESLDSVDFS
jgi:hypothetical protein